MTRLGLSLFTLAAFGIACGPEELAPSAAATSAITDGTLDTAHPSVGLLLVPSDTPGKVARCTATLIAAEWALTAAHCLKPGGAHTLKLDGQDHPVKKVIPHPEFDPVISKIPPENDIGLALLEKVSAVGPVPISIWAPQQGASVTLVGFGMTAEGANDGGTKRVATNSIQEVVPLRFSISGTGGGVGNVCHGDSGGPAFTTLNGQDVQVGVTSAAEGICGTTSWETRVDAYREWIVATTGGEVLLPDGEAPKVTITAPGSGAEVACQLTVEASASDDRKVSSVTLLVDGEQRASKTDPPFSFSLELAPGKHLLKAVARDGAANEGSDQVEVEAFRGTLAFGLRCTSFKDCVSAICVAHPNRPESYCSERCDPADPRCPGGGACSPAEPGHVCGLPPDPEGRPPIGGGCSTARARPQPGAVLLDLLGLALPALLCAVRACRSRRADRRRRGPRDRA